MSLSQFLNMTSPFIDVANLPELASNSVAVEPFDNGSSAICCRKQKQEERIRKESKRRDSGRKARGENQEGKQEERIRKESKRRE